jgi:hypothetical protein
MRLPRFRLRTLMIAVAVAAVATGGEVMRRRSVHSRKQARYYADLVRIAPMFHLSREMPPEQAWRYRQAQIRWWQQMARKYERAARYPFLSVAPDPPPPG